MPARAASEAKLPDSMFKAMQTVLDVLFAQTDEDGRDISEMYHDLVPKRSLPDYYKVIKTPMAMNPVQNAVKKRNYSSFAGFVRDCAQIFHNAKVYNRPGSSIYEDAVTLENVLQIELRRLKTEGIIDEKDSQLPDLGPIPPPSPAESGSQEPAEDDSAADDDEEEEPEDEEEDSSRRKTRRRRPAPKRGSTVDEDEDNNFDPRPKRGRPPKNDTPAELRIKNIMKGLRKARDEEGHLRVTAFERLPDAKQLPDYYETIKNPIALDVIKRKILRREYRTVEQFEADIRLMCENAKTYNEDDSDIFKDASAILDELSELAEAEKARNDSDFGAPVETVSRVGAGKHSRFPLKSIEHKGDQYVVGDWVHITNPNDLSKPTVAQIFRMWEDAEGQKWINACWYFRPEQTVHPYDQKFYEHEVLKTGQYRDHLIGQVFNKCFVMFFTRYSRGRPRGIGKRQVYVCESRYNADDKTFSKIKTWNRCIPEELRGGVEYEMDLFDKQVIPRKGPSPIAHLLPPSSDEEDDLPEPKGNPDVGPPAIGAVYRSSQQYNASPPFEPTPPPQRSVSAHPAPAAAKPAAPEPQSADYHENLSMTQMYKQAHAAAAQVPASPQPPAHHPASATPAHHHHQPQHRPAPATPHSMAAGPHYAGHVPMMRPGPAHQQQQQPYTPAQHPPMPHTLVPNMYPVQPQLHPQQQQHPQYSPHPQQALALPPPQPQMYASPQQGYVHPQHQLHQQPPPPQVIHHHIPPPQQQQQQYQQQHVQYSPHPQQQQQHMQYAPQPLPPQHMAPQYAPMATPVHHHHQHPLPPQPQMQMQYAPPPPPPQQMHHVPPPPPPQQQQQQHQLMRGYSQQQQQQQQPVVQHQLQQQQQPIYHQPQQQHQQQQHHSSPAPIPPSTFILPDSTTSGIPESIAQQFLRDDEGRILWFSVPPMEATTSVSGITTDSVSGGIVGSGSTVVGAGGPSHSLEYLARRKELLERKRARREEREKLILEEKRRAERVRRKESRAVEEALGKVLRVWEKQLKV
ncbi:hypothetical protein DFH27DRAFT_602595 [Peziza echinospora]|nr:hypothetical protein DFH27DRAFT_602595 [Peziza echinospora]